MPISNQSSYASTMQQFAQRWLTANTAITSDAIKLGACASSEAFNVNVKCLAYVRL